MARALSAILLLALVSGCKAGPDYAGPPSTVATGEARGAFLRAGAQDRPDAPVARWWEGLGDPLLNQLVTDALAHSPNIALAEARIAQARASLSASRTTLFPSLGTSFIAPYVNLPSGTLGLQGNGGDRVDTASYSLGFDASWEADLFGGNRRGIEAARDRADAARAGLADAQVSLSSEVTRLYVALRLRQAAAIALARQAELDQSLAELAAQRFDAGTAPAQPFLQARGLLAQSRGDLAKTRAEVNVLIDQIATLTGREPGALDATALSASAPIPLPPEQVAVGDPAGLLRRRPDIRSAERGLAAATADVGSKISDRFPKVSFFGLLGLGGLRVQDVVDPSSLLGVVLPQIRWSIFDGGRGAANIRSARGARDEAEARYRQTVLGALQDAESSLSRFGALRVAYAEALNASSRANVAAQLQEQRGEAGTTSRSDGLAARREAIRAELASLSARADLTTGYVAVQKALGLGWSDSLTNR